MSAAGAPGPGAPPAVAVVVTNYNYARFIEAAIRSVAAQTYPWFRCVIVDDRSTDDSVEVVEGILARLDDSRFELFRRAANGGQLAGMTDGLQRTREPFVAFLDADDVWHPDFLAGHVRAHLNTAHPAGFTSSDMALIDADGALLAGTLFFFEKQRSGPDGGRIPVEHLVGDPDPQGIRFGRRGEIVHKHSGEDVRHWSPTSAMVFRRALLELIWPELHPAFRISPDHYIPYLAHLVSGCLMLADVLAFYRLHGSNHYSRNLVLGGTANFAREDWRPIHAAQDSLMIAHIQRRRGDFDAALGADRTTALLAKLCGVDRFVAWKRSRPDPAGTRILRRARRALSDASGTLAGSLAALRGRRDPPR